MKMFYVSFFCADSYNGNRDAESIRDLLKHSGIPSQCSADRSPYIGTKAVTVPADRLRDASKVLLKYGHNRNYEAKCAREKAKELRAFHGIRQQRNDL
jgi:hypothetical protein